MTVQPDDIGDRRSAAAKAGEIFRAGGLVIFPTETVYGVGAWAGHDGGYERLREIKGRPVDQPFSLHIPSAEAAGRYVDLSHPRLRRWVRKLLPGPVTLVVSVSESVMCDRLAKLGLMWEQRDRLYHRGTIGLRCPDDRVAQAVLASVDGPVTASSANRRGAAPPLDAATATAEVGDAADLLIDGGRCRYSKPSTIVRIDHEGDVAKWTLLREGVYDQRTIRRLLRFTVLFVCSGNTCRSPMAEGLARQFLARERTIKAEELDAAGLCAASAGLFAADGQPASPHAAAAAAALGADLAGHRSRFLSPELVRDADVVYCMTASQVQATRNLAPEAVDNIHRLNDQADIEDPIGGDAGEYRRVAEVIRRCVEQRLKEQQP